MLRPIPQDLSGVTAEQLCSPEGRQARGDLLDSAMDTVDQDNLHLLASIKRRMDK